MQRRPFQVSPRWVLMARLVNVQNWKNNKTRGRLSVRLVSALAEPPWGHPPLASWPPWRSGRPGAPPALGLPWVGGRPPTPSRPGRLGCAGCPEPPWPPWPCWLPWPLWLTILISIATRRPPRPKSMLYWNGTLMRLAIGLASCFANASASDCAAAALAQPVRTTSAVISCFAKVGTERLHMKSPFGL